MTNTMTTSASQSTELQAVQDEFIKEMQAKGLVHALKWIDSWYQKAAGAHVASTLANFSAKVSRGDLEANELFLTEQMEKALMVTSSPTTSFGHNEFNRALVHAFQAEIETLRWESTARQDKWAAIRARLNAEMQAKVASADQNP